MRLRLSDLPGRLAFWLNAQNACWKFPTIYYQNQTLTIKLHRSEEEANAYLATLP
jgi:hypothetical protein